MFIDFMLTPIHIHVFVPFLRVRDNATARITCGAVRGGHGGRHPFLGRSPRAPYVKMSGGTRDNSRTTDVLEAKAHNYARPQRG